MHEAIFIASTRDRARGSSAMLRAVHVTARDPKAALVAEAAPVT